MGHAEERQGGARLWARGAAQDRPALHVPGAPNIHYLHPLQRICSPKTCSPVAVVAKLQGPEGSSPGCRHAHARSMSALRLHAQRTAG